MFENNSSLLLSRIITEYKLKFVHLSSEDMVTCVKTDAAKSEMTISGAFYNYAANALRLEKNQSILLVDNANSKFYYLTIGEIAKKKLVAGFRAVEIKDDIRKREYNCFISVLKGSSNEEVAERLTELGADSIFFFRSKYSQCDISQEKIERLNKIVLSASSQSRRLKAPLVKRLVFEDVANKIQDPCARSFLMAEPSLYEGMCGAGQTASGPLEALKTESHQVINIISGPEGGFEREEAIRLLSAGGPEVSLLNLKNIVLRACFAPQAALAIIKHRCGDL